MIDYGLSVPNDIDSDVAAALRILASKYRQEVGRPAKSVPKKFSEMGKALRPVLSGDSFIDEVFMQRWYVIPDAGNVGFVRGWKEDIYAPTTSKEWIDKTRIGNIVETVLQEGRALFVGEIEQRIPRTIRFRQRGTYAFTTFEFAPTTGSGDVTLGSAAKAARRSDRKVCVPTAALAAAMLLLKQPSVEVLRVAYPSHGFLVLANAYAFAAFTRWTEDLGPLPFEKK